MKILTAWLRAYLPNLSGTDRELADDLTLRGIAVEGVHHLGFSSAGESNGSLFEMDITTNRVDAMNHYGIAREAATIYDLPLPPLTGDAPPPNVLDVAPGRASDSPPAQGEQPPMARPPLQLRVEAPELCGRFTARILRDVTIGPSSGQIKSFFDLLGQKQISNAVDASNFTLLGMGHPTHAFDLDKIEGGIVVRLARPGEKLRLLDGSERVLEADDLVIADERRAISLAGVMGGWDTMITAQTRNILVESAWFDPAAIRRSSRRHLLHTDASHRFERGADFEAAPVANHLVSDLILQSGGQGGAFFDLVVPEAAARTSGRPSLTLSIAEVRRHLGTTLEDTSTDQALTAELVSRYLSALGCTLNQVSPRAGLTPEATAVFSVHLPSWRLDLEREIDLVEEVARVYGYNRFANTLPTPRPVLVHPSRPPAEAVRNRLLALGFSETVSSTFASTPESDLFAPPTAGQGIVSHVALENPLSEEASELRPSLLPGMVAMLAGNLNRDVTTVRLFEQGDVFSSASPGGSTGSSSAGPMIESVQERGSLALGLTVAQPQATNLHSSDDAPLFELKGAIESLVSIFTLPGGPEALAFTTENPPAWLEAGRSATAMLAREPLACFGELSRAEATRRKLRQPIFLAEIDLSRLTALPLRNVTARELSRFQAVERDFSFVFPDAVHWHTIASAIHALSIPELIRLNPVEVWRDEKKYPGVYSLLLRTLFQSTTRTLTDEELTSSSDRLLDALKSLGGVHRG